jgi:uncharacterized protein (DUF2147 family)
MQRINRLMVSAILALVALVPSAQARSFSFVFHGHQVRVEAPRHCRSARCISLSVPGFHRNGSQPEPEDDTAAASTPSVPAAPPAAPAKTAPALAQSAPMPAPAPVAPAPLITAATKAPVETTAAVPAPPASSPSIELAATSTRPVPPPVAAKPADAVAAVAATASPPSTDEPADSPLGDWQTEAKTGAVHIEPCGAALCGYLLNASGAKGETILVNMKPTRTALEWSGGVFSRASGNTYNGTMTLTKPGSLRVEACAIGRFFCSGNNWTRIEHKTDDVILSRRVAPQQRS